MHRPPHPNSASLGRPLGQALWAFILLLTAFSILPAQASKPSTRAIQPPTPAVATAPHRTSVGFPVELTVGSRQATFTFVIPHAGCVSLLANQPGKRETARLWGPAWLAAGHHTIALDTGRVASRSGVIECFSIDLIPRQAVGRSGNGERQFIRPMGLGWDPAHKELYVADSGNDRIVRLGADGRFIGQYGGFGLTLGDPSEEREDSLSGPWDVAPGGFSNFYVADQNNDRVCEFDAYKSYKGDFYPKANDTRSRLNRPRGLCIDFESNLWVVDSRNDRILKLAPSGAKLFELGGYGWSKWNFRDPTQVAVDPEGRIYICDPGNHRIGVFDRLGSVLLEVKDHLMAPAGVGVDPDGLIAICDEETGELGLYTPDGKRILMRNGMSDRDRFRAPCDLAITPRTLYLLDSGNHRVVLLERRKTHLESPWQAGPHVLE